MKTPMITVAGLRILTKLAVAQEPAADAALDSLLSHQPCIETSVTVELADGVAAMLKEREACVLVASALSQIPLVPHDTTGVEIARVNVHLADTYSLRMRLDSARAEEVVLAGSEWQLRIDLDEPAGSVWIMFDRYSGNVWREWRPAT